MLTHLCLRMHAEGLRISFKVERKFHRTNFYPNRQLVSVWEAAIPNHFVFPVTPLYIWPLVLILITKAPGDSVLKHSPPVLKRQDFFFFVPMTCVTDNLCVENAQFLLPVSCAVFQTPCTCWWFCGPAREPLLPSASVGLPATQCLSPPTWLCGSPELLLITCLSGSHSVSMFQLFVFPKLICWSLIPKGPH